MKCPKCQHENSEGLKFCVECGKKLEITCSNCGFGNAPSFKFCGECGQNLTLPSKPLPKDLSLDEKIEKIQRYLPKGLIEKILSQRDKIEGERKQVTVMFCDMEGFTQLTDRLGPEEAYDIMDQVYEFLIHKVHDYDGTINEMTGDGIMALFGAPIALEDAPQRAIRSAYSIHREMARFSDGIKQKKEDMPSLKMRIGIHTGPVIVGTLGNDLRVEFKAVGDTVNLASRMEGLAEPGSTYVTEDIFKVTEGLFRFESLGEKQVKGKEEPVKVYRVIAPVTRRTRFDVSAERGLTPFVGRERELELLLDGSERSKLGRGQAFSVVSEAGIGKSRLLYEFRKAVANEDVTFLEGKCLSYSRSVAYHPVIDILKSTFDIQEGDGDSDIKAKIKKGLKVLAADEKSTLPYLLELLSVKDTGINDFSMSPEAKKDRIIGAVKRIVLKGSEIRPLIMAIEDLHWSDKSTEDSLRDLLESITGARVFLIFTYRPEFVHTWGGRSYHSQVNLNRLSNRESLAMVTHLLGTEDIDRDLEDLILEKTEGVPFFTEEFIKSLIDLKIIEKKHKYYLAKDIRDITIPSTIHDVIMARVDSLPEGAKEIIQTASVIEREFSHELLDRVMGVPEKQLLSHLSALKNSELIYERGIYPDTTYVFKHALTREVVFDSILTRKKKTLHEEIGKALEDLYKDNLGEHYAILADHFIQSENYEKGAEYSGLVGKKTRRAGSFKDAIAYAEKCIVCLERLPQTDAIQKEIVDARTVLGLYYAQLNHHVKAKEAIAPITELAVRLNYKKRLSQIYTVIGANDLYIEEDFSNAVKHFEKAIDISEEVNDIASLIIASFGLGNTLSFDCEFEKGAHYFEKVLDLNMAANNLWGISISKSALSFAIWQQQGKVDLGQQTTDEALQIAEESGDIFSKCWAYTCHGASCFLKGFLEESKKYLIESVNSCEKINVLLINGFSELFLSESYFEMGEYEQAKDHFGRAIRVLEDAKLQPSLINLCRIGLIRAKVMNNEKDIDLDSLYRCQIENKIEQFEGWMRRHIGEILLSVDDRHISDAEQWIGKAIEADKGNGMRWHLAQDYALYAELIKRKGDQITAMANLEKAIEMLKECGADGWVEKYEKELVALS